MAPAPRGSTAPITAAAPMARPILRVPMLDPRPLAPGRARSCRYAGPPDGEPAVNATRRRRWLQLLIGGRHDHLHSPIGPFTVRGHDEPPAHAFAIESVERKVTTAVRVDTHSAADNRRSGRAASQERTRRRRHRTCLGGSPISLSRPQRSLGEAMPGPRGRNRQHAAIMMTPCRDGEGAGRCWPALLC
jgi:hypothetical protein